MKSQKGLPRRQAGQIVTVLTLIALGVMSVGALVAGQAVKNPTSPFYSEAKLGPSDCPSVSKVSGKNGVQTNESFRISSSLKSQGPVRRCLTCQIKGRNEDTPRPCQLLHSSGRIRAKFDCIAPDTPGFARVTCSSLNGRPRSMKIMVHEASGTPTPTPTTVPTAVPTSMPTATPIPTITPVPTVTPMPTPTPQPDIEIPAVCHNLAAYGFFGIEQLIVPAKDTLDQSIEPNTDFVVNVKLIRGQSYRDDRTMLLDLIRNCVTLQIQGANESEPRGCRYDTADYTYRNAWFKCTSPDQEGLAVLTATLLKPGDVKTLYRSDIYIGTLTPTPTPDSSLPDLRVISFTHLSDSNEFRYIIGHNNIHDTNVSVKLYGYTDFSPDRQELAVWTAHLPSSGFIEPFTENFSNNLNGIAALQVCVDEENSINERNENNNCILDIIGEFTDWCRNYGGTGDHYGGGDFCMSPQQNGRIEGITEPVIWERTEPEQYIINFGTLDYTLNYPVVYRTQDIREEYDVEFAVCEYTASFVGQHSFTWKGNYATLITEGGDVGIAPSANNQWAQYKPCSWQSGVVKMRPFSDPAGWKSSLNHFVGYFHSAHSASRYVVWEINGTPVTPTPTPTPTPTDWPYKLTAKLCEENDAVNGVCEDALLTSDEYDGISVPELTEQELINESTKSMPYNQTSFANGEIIFDIGNLPINQQDDSVYYNLQASSDFWDQYTLKDIYCKDNMGQGRCPDPVGSSDKITIGTLNKFSGADYEIGWIVERKPCSYDVVAKICEDGKNENPENGKCDPGEEIDSDELSASLTEQFLGNSVNRDVFPSNCQISIPEETLENEGSPVEYRINYNSKIWNLAGAYHEDIDTGIIVRPVDPLEISFNKNCDGNHEIGWLFTTVPQEECYFKRTLKIIDEVTGRLSNETFDWESTLNFEDKTTDKIVSSYTRGRSNLSFIGEDWVKLIVSGGWEIVEDSGFCESSIKEGYPVDTPAWCRIRDGAGDTVDMAMVCGAIYEYSWVVRLPSTPTPTPTPTEEPGGKTYQLDWHTGDNQGICWAAWANNCGLGLQSHVGGNGGGYGTCSGSGHSTTFTNNGDTPTTFWCVKYRCDGCFSSPSDSSKAECSGNVPGAFPKEEFNKSKDIPKGCSATCSEGGIGDLFGCPTQICFEQGELCYDEYDEPCPSGPGIQHCYKWGVCDGPGDGTHCSWDEDKGSYCDPCREEGAVGIPPNAITATMADQAGNGDGVLNARDLDIVVENYGFSGERGTKGDLNRDGVTNAFDYSIYLILLNK